MVRVSGPLAMQGGRASAFDAARAECAVRGQRFGSMGSEVSALPIRVVAGDGDSMLRRQPKNRARCFINNASRLTDERGRPVAEPLQRGGAYCGFHARPFVTQHVAARWAGSRPRPGPGYHSGRCCIGPNR